MKVSFVYAGRHGSNLECALALYGIAKEEGFDAQLLLSADNDRRKKVETLYPHAQFFNFLSPAGMLGAKKAVGGTAAFFTMISPKMMPLFFAHGGKKIFYFHSTYDYSFAPRTLKDLWLDFLQERAVEGSTLALATQYPLAWQLRLRMGKDVGVLPHPPYSPIRREFFEEEEGIALPFKEYFLTFGGIERASKGTDVLLKAINGTQLNTVFAGKHAGIVPEKNVVHINQWVPDSQLYHMVKNCKCVVLPYLVSSQFSGCLALAYYFRKPVIAPFSPAFEKLVEEGKTGMFFSQGDWMDLREKMELVARGKVKFGAKEIEKKEKWMEEATRKKLKGILEGI